MADLHENLRDDVRMLGESLGQTIETHFGKAFLEKIERIRQLAKAGRDNKDGENDALLRELGALNEGEVLPVARAFSPIPESSQHCRRVRPRQTLQGSMQYRIH